MMPELIQNKVQLELMNIMRIAGNNQHALATLVTMDKTRQLSIICEKQMVDYLEYRRRTRLPWSQMLPDVMWSTFCALGKGLEIDIVGIENGEYVIYLNCDDTHRPWRLSPSDSVLLARVGGNLIPIYIEASLLGMQATPNQDQGNSVTLPLNTLSNDMLEKAMKEAVEKENFELATQLRDELRSRKRNTE